MGRWESRPEWRALEGGSPVPPPSRVHVVMVPRVALFESAESSARYVSGKAKYRRETDSEQVARAKDAKHFEKRVKRPATVGCKGAKSIVRLACQASLSRARTPGSFGTPGGVSGGGVIVSGVLSPSWVQ